MKPEVRTWNGIGSKLARLALLLVLLCSTACSMPLAGGTPQSYGPCDNILYPFFFGAHWIYQTSGADGNPGRRIGLTVTKVEQAQATIHAADLSSGVVAELVAACQDGAITNFPVLQQDLLIGDLLASDISLVHHNGLFAPTAATFEESAWDLQWSVDLSISGTIEAQVGGKTVPITLTDTPVHISWQTAGAGDAAFEAVSVPAGSFPRALRVNGTATLDLSLEIEGVTLPGALTLMFTQWFEPYIGLLKMQVDGGEFTSLGLIRLPVSVNGSLELVEALTAH